MRVLVTIVLLLTLPLMEPSRLRLLLRDAQDRGVVGVTLTLRTEDRQTVTLVTDAEGVAVSAGLTGRAVWLVGGQRADGRELVAESYPAGAGFRLVLIAGQTRDVLLRLDAAHIVLDPDMILSDSTGAPLGPRPPQLVAPVPPLVVAADAAANDLAPPPLPHTARRGMLLVALGVMSVLGLALLVGLRRRRAR